MPLPAIAMSPEKQKKGGAKAQPLKKDIPDTETRYGVKFPPILGYVPASSMTGLSRKITAKVNSLDNVSYEPGGGHVEIIHRRVDFSNAKSKYDSKVNLHYKPGGGKFVIIDEKLNFKELSKSKVDSLRKPLYTPRDGDVKINLPEIAKPKIDSLNAHYHPGGGDRKIFNEKLPWLKYNKPNLPREELDKINKHVS